MIEDNWYDGMYYEIHFITDQNQKFSRGIIMPIDFSEEEVSKMFKLSIRNPIEILDMYCEDTVWISKKYFN